MLDWGIAVRREHSHTKVGPTCPTKDAWMREGRGEGEGRGEEGRGGEEKERGRGERGKQETETDIER